MAQFYQPPLTYIGGQQPHAPKDLTPSITAVPVHDPPWAGTRAHPLLYNQAIWWIAPDPQPTQAEKLSPGIPGQSVDRPPIRLQTYTWYPLPWDWVEQRKVSPQIPGRSVDNPPLFKPFTPYPLPDQPLPWTPRYYPQPLVIVAAENPPFGLRRQQDIIQDAWNARSLEWVSKAFLVTEEEVIVEFVPFNRAWLTTVLAAWQIDDPLPWKPRYYPQAGIIVVADKVPYNRAWFQPAVFLQPEPWDFPQIRKLPPAITAVAVNNPPFGIPPKWLSSVLAQSEPYNPGGLIFRPGKVIQEFVPGVVAPGPKEKRKWRRGSA